MKNAPFTDPVQYRDPEAEITLVGRVFEHGVRIGCQALEPWYGAGVLIPPEHPAYHAAVAFLTALQAAQP